MKAGLRFKWTVMVVFFIILITALTSFLNLTFGTKNLRKELVERGRTIALGAAINSEYGLFIHSKTALDPVIQAVINSPDVSYCAIYDSEGLLFTQDSNIKLRLPNILDTAAYKQQKRTNIPYGTTNIIDITMPVSTVQETTADNESSLFIDESGSNSTQKTQTIGYVKVGISEENTTARIKQLNNAIIQMSAIVILLGILFTILFVNQILHPIRILSRATEDVARGNLEVSVNIKRTDELGTLADSFEQMTKNLQETTVSRDSLMQEIAERKKTEEELKQQKERAELAVKTKSQFLANMSHEIRTPLNGVLGFTDLIKNTPLNDVQREYINTIQISGNQLLTLINDILDISKHEAGQIHLESIAFDMNDLIQKAINITEPKIKDKNIKIIYSYPDNFPKKFNGDPTRIRQILLNIIGNAAKFTEQGSITITVAIDKSKKTGKHLIKINVKDTGIGIKKEKLDMIFDAFTQADQTTTRRYGGTGLGLSICRFLVKKMDGDIIIESEEGKGSECKVTLQLEEINTKKHKNKTARTTQKLSPMQTVSSVTGIALSHKSQNLIFDYCTNNNLKFINIDNYAQTNIKETKLVICEADKNTLEQVKQNAQDIKNNNKNTGRILILPDKNTQDIDESGLDMFDIILRHPITSKAIKAGISTAILPRAISIQKTVSSIDLSDKRILLAEDNPINARFIAVLLNSLKCSYVSVENGQEAVNKLSNGDHFDMILMDIHMPVLDGIEATRIIRNELKLDIPIIAISAAAMKTEQEEALGAGINGYVTKPVEIELLKQQMLTWLNKN